MNRKPGIWLWLFAAGCMLPLVLLFTLSLSRNWLFPQILPRRFTLQNWADLLTLSGGVTASVITSMLLALVVALIATVAGFFTSRMIAYHRHRTLLLMVAYLPFVLSPVILAVCLKFYFIKLHLSGTIAGVALAQLIIAFPYTTLFFGSFWNRQVQQYQWLVNTLGGSNSKAFYMVTLPLSRPWLITCFFQAFLISWFEFGLTSIIGFGKVQTLATRVYQFLTEANIFYAALCCCLLILPPTLLLWINKKFIFRQIV